MSIAKIGTTAGAVLHLAENGSKQAAGNTQSRSTRSLHRSTAIAVLAVAGCTSLIGCGNTYRPVVSAINPVGPSSQPQKFAVAISDTGPNSPGLVTIVDFSGDTVLITAAIGVAPKYLVLAAGGSTGYTINGDGTLNVFGVSTSLIASQVLETTLLSGANPISIFPQGNNTYVTEAGRNAIAEFSGSPLALRQELSVVNPVYVVGITGAPRVYALSQGDGTTANPPAAVAIDTATNTPTARLAVGKTPVYGIMTADARRAFVLNQGDGTVSVINAQTNLLDTVPTAAPATPSLIQVGTAPIWADFAPTLSEMVVANAGNGTTNGTLSIVSIPLCNPAALVTNPNCSAANPVDATGFGTVLANVPVGISPVMVAVLQDGTRAYVANAGNPNLPCFTSSTSSNGITTTTPTGNCTVSVVNLTTNTVTATIPIAGRPAYIAATTGTPTGKVYVVCNDSNAMTVIRTDIDTVDLTIPLQGKGVSVRVTVP